MCLIIDKNIHPTLLAHISDRPIHVAKIVSVRRRLFGSKYISPYQNFEYKLGEKMPTVAIEPRDNRTGADIVNEGYHAYYNIESFAMTNEDRWHRAGMFSATSLQLGLARIPPNTLYFIGSGGDIVSETLELLDLNGTKYSGTTATAVKDFIAMQNKEMFSFFSPEIKEMYEIFGE